MRRASVRLVALGLALAASAPVRAQERTPTTGRIYTCTTPDGRRLTSDRPISECMTREQRVLRKDGSTHGTLPPAMSPEERAAAELKAREEAAVEAARRDAARHDRNLLARFPRQAAHDAARQAALDDIVKATEASQRRIKELAKEHKALDEEAEFYKGKALPPKLKQQIDTNDSAVDAQKLFISQQGEEQARVNRRFDVELARLKKLWSGAAPGSLGPPPSGKEAEPAAAVAAGASAPNVKLPKPASSSAAR